MCRVIVGVRDAEDAWSQTFLAAMRAYPDLPDDASAEAWLVSIAHRTATGVLSARRDQPTPTGNVFELQSVPGGPGEEIATGGRRSRRCRRSSVKRWRIKTSRAWRRTRS
jgi:DNA-directed RNA polymerase specialized sigma24 family protein